MILCALSRASYLTIEKPARAAIRQLGKSRKSHALHGRAWCIKLLPQRARECLITIDALKAYSSSYIRTQSLGA